jgi:cytochrome d ubiquinol oxidase subunit II
LNAENLAAGVILLALCAYTVFGGADFGGGVWVLLARGPRAGQQQQAIFGAIGPVWETNHTWLILVVVALFTNFPTAFAALFTALFAPLVLALVGIVFRGAAFAFHHFADEARARLPATESVFAVSSLLAPFALGLSVGAIAAGNVHAQPDGSVSGVDVTTWLDPFTFLCGLIAVTICALLAATFLIPRTTGALQQDFRQRGTAAALVLGALTTLALVVGHARGSFFANRLANPVPLAMVAASVALGLLTLGALQIRARWPAPVLAAATTSAILIAWGAAQYSFIVPPSLRIRDAVGPHETVVAFLIVLPIGMLILVPSVVLLYALLARGPVVPSEEMP